MKDTLAKKPEPIDKSIIYEHIKELLDLYDIDLSIKEIVETTSKEFNSEEVKGNDVKIALAEFQTHGRGRDTKVWESPFSSGICLSVFTKVNVKSIPIGLSVYMGVVLIDSLEKMGFEGIKIKWPNDLFYTGSKLGGILIELSQNKTGDLIVNFGLGINYSLPDDFYKLIQGSYKPIDLKSVKNQSQHSRSKVIGFLLCEIIKSIKQFNSNSIHEIKSRWNELDYFYNKEIKINSGDQSIRGLNKGIDSEGALLIKQKSSIKRIISGQIDL
jgi:BirA family biotin operon repressor/biotin-[acetyl-CoA-carboxylase] ligase